LGVPELIKSDSCSAVAIAITQPRTGTFIRCPTATITAALRACSPDSPAGVAPGLVTAPRQTSPVAAPSPPNTAATTPPAAAAMSTTTASTPPAA
jgi:hypothetical protein